MRTIGFLFCMTALLSVSCTAGDGGSKASGDKGEPVYEELSVSPSARAVLDLARASVRSVKDISPRAPLPLRADPRPRETSFLARGTATRFFRVGDAVHAELGQGGRGALESTLPRQANESVQFRGGGIGAKVRLNGAAGTEAEVAGDGYVVYRSAFEGAHVLHRPGETSEEDFVFLPQKPNRPQLDYALDLEDTVAGVRVVANTIELLDYRGVPRLRMAPPYLVDAAGKRQQLQVSVDGCATDTGTTPPWDRAFTRAGASACAIHVAWEPDTVTYPLVVDPSWSTTGSMVVARFFHTATKLNDGRVLVTGGTPDVVNAFDSAELFDPALGVWTATATMGSERWSHSATLLPSGRVLVVAGWNPVDANQTAELYDPALGQWLTAGAPSIGRAQHVTALLNDDTVLVGGGVTWASGNYVDLTSSERYFELTNSWVSAGNLADAHNIGTADVLPNGTVLVAGGYEVVTNIVYASAELYDPATATWSATGSMSLPRNFHASAPLPNGNVLVMGGRGSAMSLYASAEIYNAATGTWTSTGSMAADRGAFTATALPGSGRILVAGGVTGSPFTQTSSAELFDPSTSTWSSTTSLNIARSNPTATVVGGGVLIAGGLDVTNTVINDTEAYLP